jgi:hypothetical protein
MEEKAGTPYRKNAKPPEAVCPECKTLRWQRNKTLKRIVVGVVSAVLLSSLLLAFFFGIGVAVDLYDGLAGNRHYVFAWAGACAASLAFVGCIGAALPVAWSKFKWS